MRSDECVSRRFTLVDPGCSSRVIRGRVDAPADAGVEKRYPHVVIVHGFKGFMNWGFFPELGARLAAAGYAAVLFNTSSSGIGEDLESFTEVEAFERCTYTKDLEDIERVRDEIKSGRLLGVDPEKGAILGHSKGGGEVLLHAAEAGDYSCVIAWAAIHTASRFDEETIERWRREGHLEIANARTGQVFKIQLDGLHDYEANKDRFDIQAATGRITVPTLFVHGTRDESVEVGALDALLAARGPGGVALRLKDAGHTFGIKHPMTGSEPDFEAVWAKTKAFLEEHLETGA
jgi:dienelactone hydrolase